jgi:hypothetical protein
MSIWTATSAIHVEFVKTYSTDSFLMAIQRFMCVRGTPCKLQSDRGDQVIAASEPIESWDLDRVVQKWAGKKGIKWHLVPTGGQHFNGQAE